MESVNPYIGPLRLLRFQLEELKKNAAELDRKRADVNLALEGVEGEIRRLEKAIEEIAGMAGEPRQEIEVVGLGLTDAVRAILQKASTPMAPTDVKAKLLERGYDFGTGKDPVSSISTTLKRLVKAGHAHPSSDGTRMLYSAVDPYFSKMGRKGGLKRSPAKTKASRINIAKAHAAKRTAKAVLPAESSS